MTSNISVSHCYSKLDFYSRVSHSVLFSVSAWLLCPPPLWRLLHMGGFQCLLPPFMPRRSVYHIYVWGERCVEKQSHLITLSGTLVRLRCFTPWEELGSFAFPPNTLLCKYVTNVRYVCWFELLDWLCSDQLHSVIYLFIHKHILLCYRWHCRNYSTQTSHF